MSREPERTRRRRWLVAGGLMGRALAPPDPYRRALRLRAMRLGAPVGLGDPVAPFLEAPCHAGEEPR
ncbi:MAG: hypothetical protein QOK40_3058 [Miltoncostaeaceae bacterium]|jgi:hypothetical protein|nr:hypothetical protein [Miltoncostaeaceae bacterium]